VEMMWIACFKRSEVSGNDIAISRR